VYVLQQIEGGKTILHDLVKHPHLREYEGKNIEIEYLENHNGDSGIIINDTPQESKKVIEKEPILDSGEIYDVEVKDGAMDSINAAPTREEVLEQKKEAQIDTPIRKGRDDGSR